MTWISSTEAAPVVLKASMCGSSPHPHHNFTGVIWFRQVVKDTEITGMQPPYGAKTRTDEDEIYGELKAA
jgi:hypothetical protein